MVTLPGDQELESEAKQLESDAIDRPLELQEAWLHGGQFKLEFLAYRSFEDEFGRAVIANMSLIPIVFVIMATLCVLIFIREIKFNLGDGWELVHVSWSCLLSSQDLALCLSSVYRKFVLDDPILVNYIDSNSLSAHQ